jgi:hypothetical protein
VQSFFESSSNVASKQGVQGDSTYSKSALMMRDRGLDARLSHFKVGFIRND